MDMTEYHPVFWDIETTGLNPLAREFWNNTMGAQVTAVGFGVIENFHEGPMREEAELRIEVVLGEDEYELLQEARSKALGIQLHSEPFFVGYNSRNFDHPYMGARYSRLRQDGEPFVSDWKRLDMMRVAGKDGAVNRRYPKESEYAEALGVEVPDPYDGGDMPEAFKNRNWEAIETHVEADVKESMLMFLKRRDMMMDHFFDHYDIDADGATVPELDLNGENAWE